MGHNVDPPEIEGQHIGLGKLLKAIAGNAPHRFVHGVEILELAHELMALVVGILHGADGRFINRHELLIGGGGNIIGIDHPAHDVLGQLRGVHKL